MDQLVAFVQDRWLLLVGAAIALFVVIKLVKTVVKWVVVIVLAAMLLVYGANYIGDLKEISGKIINYSKEEAVKALVGQSNDAAYQENADGTFTVSTDHIQLTGKLDSNKAVLTVYKQTFEIKLDDALNKMIEKLKRQ